MKSRNLIIITKIILFYSLFFIGLKLFVIFQGAWAGANLILCIPFLLLAATGIYILKSEKYSWIYVVGGILTIGVIRAFEKEWAVQLHSYFQ